MPLMGPSESEERADFWVDCDKHSHDAMTHRLLDADTHKMIYMLEAAKSLF